MKYYACGKRVKKRIAMEKRREIFRRYKYLYGIVANSPLKAKMRSIYKKIAYEFISLAKSKGLI